ncbi:GNAT family N-acetyltransferase [Leifsonia soli]|uniref:Ribosomal protein S18 acetylase RimI-like enzyme n=1 Tax=Leifsonia soli TaxID=582665 RepID=A0A852T0L6_9MICO|nr:GNAT family N-acetyltransferase [Leifsonia soli]NYD74190.1 ribosomal protein S18 acetylase RimI-like enzyme [Leifsonia soli]
MKAAADIEVASTLSSTDLDAVERLLPLLSSTAGYDRNRMLAMLDHPGLNLFVARVGGEIVGMATLATFPLPTGWRGHVDDVVVDDTQRGKGIARSLLVAIIQLARERGLRTLDLTSRPSRASAIHLYESVGFERRDSVLMRFRPTEFNN